MFSASSLYFLVAIFGESIESNETHISQPVEGQEKVVNDSGGNESQVALKTHNETSETPQQHLQEEQALAQNASESNQIIGSIFTNQRIILCLLNSYHRSLK